MLPIALAIAVGLGAVAIVAYLLWPTWSTENAGAPDRLPISIGGTLFNVPAAAMRVKIQRHSGQQERIDLNFSFPSLEPPQPQKHVSADEGGERHRQHVTALVPVEGSKAGERKHRHG